jgi:hypothetical protein
MSRDINQEHWKFLSFTTTVERSTAVGSEALDWQSIHAEFCEARSLGSRSNYTRGDRHRNPTCKALDGIFMPLWGEGIRPPIGFENQKQYGHLDA